MNLTSLLNADVHFLPVLVVSLVLCLACFCVLVRVYRRKHHYRGKQREIQRPFIKGKRGSQSPRSPLLFGNLFTNEQSGSPPRRPHSRSPLNNSIFQGKLPIHRSSERNFLGDVITSINQQQRQTSSKSEMRKVLAPKKLQVKVLFTPHHPQHQNKEGQNSGGELEEEETEARIIFHKEGLPNSKSAAQDGPNPETAAQTVTLNKASASFLSKCTSSDSKKKQLWPLSTAKPKTRICRPQQHQPQSIFYDTPLMTEGRHSTAWQTKPLWAHSCDSQKLTEKAAVEDCHKEPLSVKTERADKLECDFVKSSSFHCDRGGKCETFEGCAETALCYSSSNNGSAKGDSNEFENMWSDSLDNLLGESKSQTRRKKDKKNSKTSDQEEANSCSHKVSNASDIVANASKTEVYCKLCGITLSKPQCFYSLGSLCSDGEFCETDSDDINRHPVVDIDDNPPLVEVQSHHDTGYTSSDDFENESNLSKELSSAWLQDKRETDSYDGDYESDNEETGLRPDRMADDMALKPLASVGEPVAIKDYALREWKSDTSTSRAMKKGYGCITSRTGCHHLRKIRGDNYCAIRAVLFQVLAGRLPILDQFASKEKSNLEEIPISHADLNQWSFANRLPVTQNEVIPTLEKFVAFFISQIRKICSIPSQLERMESILSLLNNETEEFKLLEATKLLMYDAAVQLHRRSSKGEDVPVFAMLLFARDSCESPRDLLINHLNRTGDSGGLEQVEMCLLGYTLGVVIQVIRPSQVDKEDFIAFYPYLDDVPQYTPTVTLVAEDDRHYNIVM